MPKVTKNLLIINALAFAAMYVLRTRIDINDVLGLHFFLAPDFKIYQLITYMFMHASFEHIFFNMFALWMFGCVVERVWGPKRYLTFYLICGIGAGLFQEVAQYGTYVAEGLASYNMVSLNGMRISMDTYLNQWTTVGASGAVYGLLLAFGMIFPEERLFIFPLPVPIKAKWFVMLYAGISLIMALTTTGGNVAHFAHLGGMVVGFFIIKYWQGKQKGSFNRIKGEYFFENLKKKWQQHTHKQADGITNNSWDRPQSDWDYNTQKQKEQEEVDRILDKIRKSGYDSLTAEEKQQLFDNSQRK